MNRTNSQKTTLLLLLLLLWIPLVCGAQETGLSALPGEVSFREYCEVYFYPHVLDREDRLQDGPDKRAVPIEGKTLLVWVDREPEMDYAHPTLYILISREGIRILDGKWWPVVNGKKVLYGEEDAYALLSPFTLGNDSYTTIDVYVYPHELYPSDRLIDGYSGDLLKIVDTSLLIWVDMMPQAKYTHPTAYILISKEYTYVQKGGWWPELNGKRILYGEQNSLGVVSPFLLLNSYIDTID
jgi:hypothetical protein